MSCCTGNCEQGRRCPAVQTPAPEQPAALSEAALRRIVHGNAFERGAPARRQARWLRALWRRLWCRLWHPRGARP